MKIVPAASAPLAPPELAELAHDMIKKFHECSWWWNHDFKITTLDDVREVIAALRKGGHQAWAAAQSLQKCL